MQLPLEELLDQIDGFRMGTPQPSFDASPRNPHEQQVELTAIHKTLNVIRAMVAKKLGLKWRKGVSPMSETKPRDGRILLEPDIETEIWQHLNGMENCETWAERRKHRNVLEQLLGLPDLDVRRWSDAD